MLVARDITHRDPAGSGTGGAARTARAIGEARVARPVRRRHRARDEQPAAGRARPSGAADRDLGGRASAPPRSAPHLPRGRPRREDRPQSAGLRRLAADDAPPPAHQPRRVTRAVEPDRVAQARRHRGRARAARGPAGGFRRPAADAPGVSEHHHQRRARHPRRRPARAHRGAVVARRGTSSRW